MASRQVVQHQNRGGEAVQGGVKQKNIGGERKNRRALGDIGNVVIARGGAAAVPADGKPIVQVSRPVTRSFCAQLLANAQAQKNKTSAAIVADGALPEAKKAAGAGRKPAAKKAAAPKPKPEEIIEISPDSTEIPKEKEKVAAEKLAKKKAPSFSTTLTARSKAACGLSKRPPKELQIVDIDAADINNDLAVVEYIDDIYKFYKSAEHEGRVHDYMDSQPEISEKMRAILVDWLVQVHEKFELSQETLYLTINILDRYLAAKITSRGELQLVGLSSMLIASKYEEIWAPEVEDLVGIADRAYSNKQILVMEKRILGELEWMLTVPTPYVFLVRFIKASQTESDVENMVYFLAELGMMNYSTLIYCPSMIAASAVYVARSTLGKSPAWNDTLKLHTGFSETQLSDCAKLLAKLHSSVAEMRQRGIYRKYSSSERCAVALLPPPAPPATAGAAALKAEN
ncbi:G2/mitotic-specific cyclin-1-like [Andrographis paniculata]|uniref:G2/mitotic-specific cyclin-1-like n=1 Tax=Andrographis paniculata TaxID=175694 RepID=UPI0021E711AE|nr:G2/mitotic-specific cyclin-1-like [Andrographis paniculata]